MDHITDGETEALEFRANPEGPELCFQPQPLTTHSLLIIWRLLARQISTLPKTDYTFPNEGGLVELSDLSFLKLPHLAGQGRINPLKNQFFACLSARPLCLKHIGKF